MQWRNNTMQNGFLTTNKSKKPKHINRRFKERFGYDITKAEIRDIIQDIKQGKSEFMHSSTEWADQYRVTWYGKKLIAIYDHKANKLLTVYPDDDDNGGLMSWWDDIKKSIKHQ